MLFRSNGDPKPGTQLAMATPQINHPLHKPVSDQPHSMVVYHGSTHGAPSTFEQFTFENAKSRTIVGLGLGPVNRNGRSLLDDEWGGQGPRDAGDPRHRPKLGSVPDFSKLEAD